MVCAALVVFNLLKDRLQEAPPNVQALRQGHEECAIQLVRLGADCDRRLDMAGVHFNAMRMFSKLDGKTALELATLSGRPQLVEAMHQYYYGGTEQRLRLVHCRCGSRFPWYACHNAGIGKHPHFVPERLEGGECGRILWRYSPLAKCP